MALFEQTPIFLDEETVAEQLRRRRQEKGLTLEAVAKRLKIRADYLDALEKGQRNRLPKGVYGRTFLREYCQFLGLDYKILLRHFEGENVRRRTEKPDVFERQVVARRQLLSLPLLVRNAIIGALIVACLTYLGFLLKEIFEPPFLEIGAPAENFVTADSRLVVQGRTEPETEVLINGQEVLVNAEGTFEREIYVQEGLNTITITAEKKYSRAATVSRQVFLEEPDAQP